MGAAIMNEARAVRYRRFACALPFAGLFFGRLRRCGAFRRALPRVCAGIRPAFSTWRTQ